MGKLNRLVMLMVSLIVIGTTLAGSQKLEASIYINFDEKASSFQWPLNDVYNISSPYGNRVHPISKNVIHHNGIDIAAPLGTEVHSINAGTVTYTGFQVARGYYIIVKNGNTKVLYQHLKKNSIKVKIGQSISKGQVIANVGNTGASTGPHLHLEIFRNNTLTNPLSYTYHKYNGVKILDDKQSNLVQKKLEKKHKEEMIDLVRDNLEDDSDLLLELIYNS